MGFNTPDPEKKQAWLDQSLWTKDSVTQSQKQRENVAGRSSEQDQLIGQGFAASDNMVLEDPEDKAIRQGLKTDDPFAQTDSAGAGAAGGIAGGLMSVTGFIPALFAIGDDGKTDTFWQPGGRANFSKGWNATSNWLRGKGSKAEMDYYFNGTIPDGYEEDADGNLVKKKVAVDISKGYEKSGRSGGSGFS